MEAVVGARHFAPNPVPTGMATARWIAVATASYVIATAAFVTLRALSDARGERLEIPVGHLLDSAGFR